MQTTLIQVDPQNFRDEELFAVVECINNGQVVGVPKETVYAVCADATNSSSVASLFAAKNRPIDNPLVVHVSDVPMMERLVENINSNARMLMQHFWPGAVTLVFRSADKLPRNVTAGLNTIAIRIPSNPILRRIISLVGRPCVASSGNLSTRPSPTTAHHVIHDMNSRIPLIVNGGDSEIGMESTIIDCTGDTPVLMQAGAILVRDILAVVPSMVVPPRKRDVLQCTATSFGMKYKHYAPSVPAVLVVGSVDNVRKVMQKRIEECSGKVGIITTDDVQYNMEKCVVERMSESNRLRELNFRLFKCLRKLENEVDCILVQGVPFEDEGEAVMDILLKACDVVNADMEHNLDV